MSQQPGGYTRTFIGRDPLSGKPMYRDEPSTIWTSQAATWPVTIVSRETEPGHLLGETSPVKQTHLVCVNCYDLPSVFCLDPGTDRNSAYTITAADLLAGILAHIRRSHPDVVAS